MTNPKLEISIDKCFTLFGQSFNRVKFFSCITDNITSEHFPKEWSIKKPLSINYGIVKEKPTEKETAMLVSGYKHFMQRYLVRDCIESFASSLDTLFFVLLINGKRVLSKNRVYDLYGSLSKEESEIYENFKNAGLVGKMQTLENSFNLNIPKDHKRIITSLKDVRNCLSHNNGIVRPTDGKKDGKNKRKFHWTVLHMFAIGKSGEQYEIEIDKPFKEEVQICMKIQDYFKSFEINQPLSFSASDTYEIGLSLDFVALEYLKEIGRIINNK